MVTVLVTGGRDYRNRVRLYRVLDEAVVRLGMTELVHGDATGADALAKEWAVGRGIAKRDFPAAWDDLSQPGARIKQRADGTLYDAAAGSRRNAQMLRDGRPAIVLAFKGNSGTADMVRQAEAAKIRVIKNRLVISAPQRSLQLS